MKIVADENIPLVDTFFSDIGEITKLPGRGMSATDVKDADVLLVRSVTQVNQALIEGSSVKFVGTATIGTDHIDTEFLTANNVAFASAPGCNAQSVVNYVISTLVHFEAKTGDDWRQKRIGIIGCGNVGGSLLSQLKALRVDVVVYDPFKMDEELPLIELDELLSTCDVICMHTPYTQTGEFPTHHLINANRLKQMKDGAWLINAGRGGAIDNQALKSHLVERPNLFVALDVWENEPTIDQELLTMVDIATPHIAGYSLDGKLQGTEMIYQALCQHFGLPVRQSLAQLIPEPAIKQINFSANAVHEDIINQSILLSYDVYKDHMRMMRTLNRSSDLEQAGKLFDEMRKTYPARRDFGALKVQMKKRQYATVEELESLGFQVK